MTFHELYRKTTEKVVAERLLLSSRRFHSRYYASARCNERRALDPKNSPKVIESEQGARRDRSAVGRRAKVTLSCKKNWCCDNIRLLRATCQVKGNVIYNLDCVL